MKRLTLAGSTLALYLIAGTAWADAAVMRVSHQLPPQHHIAQLVEQWAADIEASSNGAVDVQVFPADQAFKPEENFPAVARGQIEAALSVNFQWGKTIPEMNITLMPYSFTDMALMRKFPGSDVATFLEEKLAAKGVKNIAWLFTTNSSIYTSSNKPLIKPEDFQGVKIRGLNKLVDSGLVALGAAPASMPGSEVYQALQTKVIDAGLTDVSAAYSRKYYEVQEFGTVSPLFSVFFHVYVNPGWWEGLDQAARDAIVEASAKAEQAALDITEQSASEAPGQLEEKGMKIHIHTPEEQAVFKDIMKPPFVEAFVEAGGDESKKLIEMIESL